MKEKLLKVLNIKIDAINQNIENLNYLNGELEKNNNDLNYIQSMIDLFKDNELLNFDNISRSDFDKILTMIDPSVTEIFKDKTCNYEGIIYIIQGIRQSISLQLTEEQSNAINKFIEGMKDKEVNLQEVISNLFESKNRLPETDLTILQGNLENFKNIVSKFENELYLTEIDDISESLDFASVSVEDKADVFEYVLKYNSNIYNTLREELRGNNDLEENKIDLPEFNYEPIDLTSDNFEEDKDIEENKFDDIKFDLNNIVSDNNETKEDTDINVPVVNVDYELPPTELNIEDNETNSDNSISENTEPDFENHFEDLKANEDNHELNTVELEDIIQKIDAKLKEMEEENSDDTVVSENNLTEAVDNKEEIANVFNKYAFPVIELTNNNVNEIDLMFSVLNDNNLLEYLKNKEELLKNILETNNSSDLQDVISLIKDNLIVKDNYNEVLEIVLTTMPILFVNPEVINSFKENIEFYKDKNINIINLFDNYRELLIINHKKLEENYNKVINYGLEINNDNIKYLLYNKEVLKKLDYYIEAIGYEKGFLGKEDYFDGIEYIKKNPYKLNDINRDTLIKLRYASENGIKIYGNKPGMLSGEISNSKVDVLKIDDEYKNLYFDSKYNFIDENNLKLLQNEIDSAISYDMVIDDNLNKLEEKYKKNDLKYKINNIFISRIKTIRVYNILKEKLSRHDALLIALTYNSVLKMDEYEAIVKIVDSIVGGN